MSKENEIGVLWKNKSAKGEVYFSGQIAISDQVVKVVVFANKYKKNDKEPDYRILRSTEKPPTQEALPIQEALQAGDEFDDDIPF